MKIKLLGLFSGLLAAASLAAAIGLSVPCEAAAKASRYSKVFVVGVLNGVHVVDLKSGKELKRIDTGLIPHNMLLSRDGRDVYVSNIGSQSVSVIDAQTLKKVKDLLVGQIPDLPAHRKLAPAMLHAATSCYACHASKVLGTMPNALAWAADGHLLVSEARGRAIDWIDPASGKTVARHTFTLPTPSSPANMAVVPGTGEIWVLHRFESLDKHPKGVHMPSERGREGGFEHDPPAGQHFSWVTVHDRTMHRELARIKMDMAVPFGYVFSPDGRYLYVAYRSSNTIAVFDTRKRALLKKFSVGVTPTGLAISPDGKELYTTLVFSQPPAVQVIDARTGKIKVSLGTPPSPELVRVDPTTGYLYVTAAGTNRLLEIDPRHEKLLRELPSGHQPLDCLLVP